MNDGKQSTPPDELERQICSATESKNEREWWAHHEIARLLEISRLRAELLEASKASLTAERERADTLMRRLVAIEDEHIAYADDVGDALGQGEDEPLLTCARRVMAEVERLQARDEEWRQKASAWMASPEAAQRLDGYRELAQRLNAAEDEVERLREDRDTLISAVDTLRAALTEAYDYEGSIAKLRAAIDAARGES